jgi:hypothetical protein
MGKDLVMGRLRNAVLAVALATGGVGCATFCDECDDFPIPGGPGGYAQQPGSYAGGPLSSAPDTAPAGGPMLAPGTSSSSGATTGGPAGSAAPTPPAPPAARPSQDAVANPPVPNASSATPLPTDGEGRPGA